MKPATESKSLISKWFGGCYMLFDEKLNALLPSCTGEFLDGRGKVAFSINSDDGSIKIIPATAGKRSRRVRKLPRCEFKIHLPSHLKRQMTKIDPPIMCGKRYMISYLDSSDAEMEGIRIHLS